MEPEPMKSMGEWPRQPALRAEELGRDPTGSTADGFPMVTCGRVFVRAVLVDPTRRATVIRALERRTPGWASGEPTSLWEVRLADGRVCVVDPALVTVRPIAAHLDALRQRHKVRLAKHWLGIDPDA
jgi:hypothetical protein